MGNVSPEGVNNSFDLPPSVSDYVTPQYSPIKKSQGLPAKKPVNGEDAGIAPRPPVNKRTKAIFCPQVSRGLQNVGNSCYGNAVIQALFSTPLFPQDIIQLHRVGLTFARFHGEANKKAEHFFLAAPVLGHLRRIGGNNFICYFFDNTRV